MYIDTILSPYEEKGTMTIIIAEACTILLDPAFHEFPNYPSLYYSPLGSRVIFFTSP